MSVIPALLQETGGGHRRILRISRVSRKQRESPCLKQSRKRTYIQSSYTCTYTQARTAHAYTLRARLVRFYLRTVEQAVFSHAPLPQLLGSMASFPTPCHLTKAVPNPPLSAKLPLNFPTHREQLFRLRTSYLAPSTLSVLGT